jgi:hypothetical protein
MLLTVDGCIREAARQAAVGVGVSPAPIEQFLRMGDEMWEGAGSGQFTRAALKQDEIHSQAAKAALRNLLRRLADLVPSELRSGRAVGSEVIRERVSPIVRGLVQADWQEIALRELTRRTFVLNFAGTQVALEAELSTGFLSTAWQVLWAFHGDCGLKPDEIVIEIDGVSGGEFAHVRWSAYQTDDLYSDVIVHEAAHLLHYLKPEHYGLRVRRGQERFVDVEFRHRELFAFACEAYSQVVKRGDRRTRMSFAANMTPEAHSFPPDQLDAVAALVQEAARARNGWSVIREATVIPRTRRVKTCCV